MPTSTTLSPSCPGLDLGFLDDRPRYTSSAILVRMMSESPLPEVLPSSPQFESPSSDEHVVLNVNLTDDCSARKRTHSAVAAAARKVTFARVAAASMVIVVVLLIPIVFAHDRSFCSAMFR